MHYQKAITKNNEKILCSVRDEWRKHCDMSEMHDEWQDNQIETDQWKEGTRLMKETNADINQERAYYSTDS